MFTHIEGTIPLTVPGERNPIPARFTLDEESGKIEIVAESYKVTRQLLEIFRVNHVVTIDVSIGYVPAQQGV